MTQKVLLLRAFLEAGARPILPSVCVITFVCSVRQD